MCRYANSSVVAATMPVPGKERARDPSPEMGVGDGDDNNVRTGEPPMVGLSDSRDQHLAKQELDLLAKLIGGQPQTKDTFRLSIFEDKLGAAPKKYQLLLLVKYDTYIELILIIFTSSSAGPKVPPKRM